ncbi:MAG: hypothetical protein M0Z51_13685 [Propionibacterium sp.]|nr:hypothetical protein [Propionibacterium sp.]
MNTMRLVAVSMLIRPADAWAAVRVSVAVVPVTVHAGSASGAATWLPADGWVLDAGADGLVVAADGLSTATGAGPRTIVVGSVGVGDTESVGYDAF